MRAEPDGPGVSVPREPQAEVEPGSTGAIRIVMDRLVMVEFRPSSTLTPAMLDGAALRPPHQPHRAR